MQNANGFLKRRSIDIVFCIDGTGSMTPCFENIKANARRFYSDFSAAMTAMNSDIDMMRIKFIIFRDFLSDGSDAMVQSPFFELPDETAELDAFLAMQVARGGCDQDANGLEALAVAMKSDFVVGNNDRQIIVLCADTTAIPLGKRVGCVGYPQGLPKNEDELLSIWVCADQMCKLRERNKRLVMFAPEGSVYDDMKRTYNRSYFHPVNIHRGLDEISFDDLIKQIAASASN